MYSPHPHLDMDDQYFSVESHKGKLHSDWVSHHQNRATMDHPSSRAKALLLVAEAARLELQHLEHQREHAQWLLQRSNGKAGFVKSNRLGHSHHNHNSNSNTNTPAASPIHKKNGADCENNFLQENIVGSPSSCADSPSASCSPSRRRQNVMSRSSPSPSRHNNKHHHKRSMSAPPPPSPVACGCLHVAAWRLMTPRCRVMALLKKHGEKGNLETIVDALRSTYSSDSEMMEEMESRYGPEPKDIDPELLLLSVEEREQNHESRWAAIRENVDYEMQTSANAFANVIRTLSVMRIFIEGSQGQTYGIDFTDRQRREAAQQAVLAKLRANRAQFVDQCDHSP